MSREITETIFCDICNFETEDTFIGEVGAPWVRNEWGQFHEWIENPHADKGPPYSKGWHDKKDICPKCAKKLTAYMIKLRAPLKASTDTKGD